MKNRFWSRCQPHTCCINFKIEIANRLISKLLCSLRSQVLDLIAAVHCWHTEQQPLRDQHI
uniref:Uncharacterized protein n=1 Tax=Rhizophora mucronata TaxID=61149 RepID=A0A2P2PX61_RHIMU